MIIAPSETPISDDSRRRQERFHERIGLLQQEDETIARHADSSQLARQQALEDLVATRCAVVFDRLSAMCLDVDAVRLEAAEASETGPRPISPSSRSTRNRRTTRSSREDLASAGSMRSGDTSSNNNIPRWDSRDIRPGSGGPAEGCGHSDQREHLSLWAPRGRCFASNVVSPSGKHSRNPLGDSAGRCCDGSDLQLDWAAGELVWAMTKKRRVIPWVEQLEKKTGFVIGAASLGGLKWRLEVFTNNVQLIGSEHSGEGDISSEITPSLHRLNTLWGKYRPDTTAWRTLTSEPRVVEQLDGIFSAVGDLKSDTDTSGNLLRALATVWATLLYPMMSFDHCVVRLVVLIRERLGYAAPCMVTSLRKQSSSGRPTSPFSGPAASQQSPSSSDQRAAFTEFLLTTANIWVETQNAFEFVQFLTAVRTLITTRPLPPIPSTLVQDAALGQDVTLSQVEQSVSMLPEREHDVWHWSLFDGDDHWVPYLEDQSTEIDTLYEQYIERTEKQQARLNSSIASTGTGAGAAAAAIAAAAAAKRVAGEQGEMDLVPVVSTVVDDLGQVFDEVSFGEESGFRGGIKFHLTRMPIVDVFGRRTDDKSGGVHGLSTGSQLARLPQDEEEANVATDFVNGLFPSVSNEGVCSSIVSAERDSKQTTTEPSAGAAVLQGNDSEENKPKDEDVVSLLTSPKSPLTSPKSPLSPRSTTGFDGVLSPRAAQKQQREAEKLFLRKKRRTSLVGLVTDEEMDGLLARVMATDKSQCEGNDTQLKDANTEEKSNQDPTQPADGGPDSSFPHEAVEWVQDQQRRVFNENAAAPVSVKPKTRLCERRRGSYLRGGRDQLMRADRITLEKYFNAYGFPPPPFLDDGARLEHVLSGRAQMLDIIGTAVPIPDLSTVDIPPEYAKLRRGLPEYFRMQLCDGLRSVTFYVRKADVLPLLCVPPYVSGSAATFTSSPYEAKESAHLGTASDMTPRKVRNHRKSRNTQSIKTETTEIQFFAPTSLNCQLPSKVLTRATFDVFLSDPTTDSMMPRGLADGVRVDSILLRSLIIREGMMALLNVLVNEVRGRVESTFLTSAIGTELPHLTVALHYADPEEVPFDDDEGPDGVMAGAHAVANSDNVVAPSIREGLLPAISQERAPPTAEGRLQYGGSRPQSQVTMRHVQDPAPERSVTAVPKQRGKLTASRRQSVRTPDTRSTTAPHLGFSEDGEFSRRRMLTSSHDKVRSQLNSQGRQLIPYNPNARGAGMPILPVSVNSGGTAQLQRVSHSRASSRGGGRRSKTPTSFARERSTEDLKSMSLGSFSAVDNLLAAAPLPKSRAQSRGGSHHRIPTAITLPAKAKKPTIESVFLRHAYTTARSRSPEDASTKRIGQLLAERRFSGVEPSVNISEVGRAMSSYETIKPEKLRPLIDRPETCIDSTMKQRPLELRVKRRWP